MNQHEKISLKLDNLKARSVIVNTIRSWFLEQKFIEIEVPQLVACPDIAPHLDSIQVIVKDEKANNKKAFFITSPEYTMKKCLSAGLENIFCLGKVFRDQESFGGTHNPEFTMLEWYRTNFDMFKLMDDVEDLFLHIFETLEKNNCQKFKFKKLQTNRMHMREVWKQYTGINLDDYLTTASLYNLLKSRGYDPNKNEPYEDLFYRIFLNEIEPNLPADKLTIIHHYPACMAALASISSDDKRYAERFEVYAGTLELANAYSELTNSSELMDRFTADNLQRKQIGKDILPIDKNLLAAVDIMPESTGIALGVDRLIMLLLGQSNINDVMALPASELFTTLD